jgi:hypothetical protein
MGFAVLLGEGTAAMRVHIVGIVVLVHLSILWDSQFGCLEGTLSLILEEVPSLGAGVGPLTDEISLFPGNDVELSFFSKHLIKLYNFVPYLFTTPSSFKMFRLLTHPPPRSPRVPLDRCPPPRSHQAFVPLGRCPPCRRDRRSWPGSSP